MSSVMRFVGLVCVSAACMAQAPQTPEYHSGANDPAAVEIPLYKGAPVEAVLTALKDKGFKIKWNSEDVLPTMTLLEQPKATRIDLLLREILKPWDLHADHNNVYGEYRIKPLKKKRKK